MRGTVAKKLFKAANEVKESKLTPRAIYQALKSGWNKMSHKARGTQWQI
jgi:hypothetical protein